jgi:hypothetical protein
MGPKVFEIALMAIVSFADIITDAVIIKIVFLILSFNLIYPIY